MAIKASGLDSIKRGSKFVQIKKTVGKVKKKKITIGCVGGCGLLDTQTRAFLPLSLVIVKSAVKLNDRPSIRRRQLYIPHQLF